MYRMRKAVRYTRLQLRSLLTSSWTTVHPQLHFISHIPQSIQGEQFVAQLFRNIPTHSWLFKYGCVPMSFIMGEWIWEVPACPFVARFSILIRTLKRVAAVRKTTPRCKVSVIAEATADMQSAVRSRALQPYESHFHPVRPNQQVAAKYDSRRIGLPLAAINILPFRDQVCFRAASRFDDFSMSCR